MKFQQVVVVVVVVAVSKNAADKQAKYAAMAMMMKSMGQIMMIIMNVLPGTGCARHSAMIYARVLCPVRGLTCWRHNDELVVTLQEI